MSITTVMELTGAAKAETLVEQPLADRQILLKKGWKMRVHTPLLWEDEDDAIYLDKSEADDFYQKWIRFPETDAERKAREENSDVSSVLIFAETAESSMPEDYVTLRLKAKWERPSGKEQETEWDICDIYLDMDGVHRKPLPDEDGWHEFDAVFYRYWLPDEAEAECRKLYEEGNGEDIVRRNKDSDQLYAVLTPIMTALRSERLASKERMAST